MGPHVDATVFNIAIDESHETEINRKLKSMTPRPFHFRTVVLANFIAYINPILTTLTTNICLFTAENKDSEKPVVLDRMRRMWKTMKDLDLFITSEEEITLKNILAKNC